ncbi:hypothetical protein BGZ67_008248 [Mortierella alpina]|nr:hypothetical protein BGZ67_008248 [Mortierella alpina]
MTQRPSGGKSEPYHGSGGKSTPLSSSAASRIQSAADRNPSSKTAVDGFKERAQAAAAKNDNAERFKFKGIVDARSRVLLCA